MNKNNTGIGIIDEIKNPFAKNQSAWVEQNYCLTELRRAQLLSLLNLGIEKIMDDENQNENRYVAFIAIRWGFTIKEEGKLRATEKLINSGMYDGSGC